MTDTDRSDAADPAAAWAELVDGLRVAGERMAAATEGLGPDERADGFRALLRALNNQLGRFEVDRDRPELVPFNEWREKMLMDNPDFRYWVADVRDGATYRIRGSMGGAAYLSITAYRADGTLEAGALSRLDSESITLDTDGRFDVVVSPTDPGAGVDWLHLPDGASVIWVRQFHGDLAHDRLGDCRIDPLDDPPPAPLIEPARFAHQVRRLGASIARLPRLLEGSTATDRSEPNTVRHWSEMAGGAAFTEPGIHYLRGSWQLEPGEALVIEGDLVACRYWNVLLYSRFCNSLDHRARTVSFTGTTARVTDGRYRFVVSADDPGADHDWLDTEGRPFGMFVFRFLHPESAPDLPRVRRCRLADLRAAEPT